MDRSDKQGVQFSNKDFNFFAFFTSFDGDDFDDVEEDEGLDDLENAEEVSASTCDELTSVKIRA